MELKWGWMSVMKKIGVMCNNACQQTVMIGLGLLAGEMTRMDI